MKLNYFFSSLTKSYQQAKLSRYPRFQYKVNAFLILLRLHLKCGGNHPPGDVKENILGFRVTASSYENLLIMFQEIALKLQYHFITQKKEPRIIDCGANIGLTVLLFKLLYPRSFILAFEPDPDNYRLLVKNLKQNKIRNVKTFNACLSIKSGIVDFYPHAANSMFSTLTPASKNEPSVSIQSMRLSELLSSEFYDLIKIDAEGSEWEIIQDLEETDVVVNCNHYIVAIHKPENLSTATLTKAVSFFEKNGFQHRKRLSHYENGDLISFFKN